MARFAANLSMMFNEVPFLDRFDAAARAGFEAVEYLFPYEFPADAIAERLKRNQLTQALFNLPPGDWSKGERGLAALPERAGDFDAALNIALPYAQATGVKKIHMMAGLADRHDAKAVASYKRSVEKAAQFFAPHGIDILLEPINARGMPGYFLNDFAFTKKLINELGLSNVKLQFDIFHRQIIHGDVVMALRDLMPMIGHVQVASVPSRHEPMSEELNDAFIFAELDRLGYQGFIGCEYIPAGRTEDGLNWFAEYRPR
jgi:2-dehydrotetronate isomerase